MYFPHGFPASVDSGQCYSTGPACDDIDSVENRFKEKSDEVGCAQTGECIDHSSIQTEVMVEKSNPNNL